MSIIYTVISRVDNESDVVNLCCYDSARGNYPNILLELIKNLKIKKSTTYAYDKDYHFNMLKDQNLLYVCMTTSNFKVKLASSFLEKIKELFLLKFTKEEINQASDFSLSSRFEDVLKTQMNYYQNSHPDKQEHVMNELAQIQKGMGENIEKVLQNEEKVELIVKKTVKYDSIADQIKKNASNIKKKAFWGRNKCKIAIGSLGVFAVLLLIFMI